LITNLESLREVASSTIAGSGDTSGEARAEVEIAAIAQRIAAELRAAQEASQGAVVARDEATESSSEVQRLRDHLVSEAQEAAAAAEIQVEKADAVVSELQAKLDQAISLEADIVEKTESFASIEQEARSGRDKIEGFVEELDAARAALEGHISRANIDEESRANLLNDVSDLVEKAESMVSAATVAGLAKAFSDERKSLEEGMKNAMAWFIVGIVSLFAVTVLLAAYVFEIPINIFGYELSKAGATEQYGDEVTVAGVISRTVILLAPFWLTLFSSRRYRSLFDLRQQYSHKYNLAFSIDGFRKQAPQYGEELVAWVFHEISQSPAVGNSRKLGDNPIPSLEELVRATVDRTNFFRRDPGGQG